jgi:hypothetical protein
LSSKIPVHEKNEKPVQRKRLREVRAGMNERHIPWTGGASAKKYRAQRSGKRGIGQERGNPGSVRIVDDALDIVIVDRVRTPEVSPHRTVLGPCNHGFDASQTPALFDRKCPHDRAV